MMLWGSNCTEDRTAVLTGSTSLKSGGLSHKKWGDIKLYLSMHPYLRVGQTDVSGSEPDRKLCQNSLCYTVANDQVFFEENLIPTNLTTKINWILQEEVKDFSCPSVLLGRFVTVQKYAASPNVASANAWCLELNEVEVTACVWKNRKQNWTICPLNSRLCKVIVSMLQRTILIKETDHSSESWYLFTHVQKWKDCLSRRSHPKIRKKRSTYWVYGLQWNRRLLTRQRFDSEMPPEKCLILFERSSNIEEFATKFNFRQKKYSESTLTI